MAVRAAVRLRGPRPTAYAARACGRVGRPRGRLTPDHPPEEAVITTPINATSWTYSEQFVAEDDVLAAARARAEEVGVVPISPGGVVVFDNALWHDRVADPSQRDEETVAIRELGRTVAEHDGLLSVLLPVGDGLLAAKKVWTPESD